MSLKMLILIFYIDIELYIKVHAYKGAVLLGVGVRKYNPPVFWTGAIRLLFNWLYVFKNILAGNKLRYCFKYDEKPLRNDLRIGISNTLPAVRAHTRMH